MNLYGFVGNDGIGKFDILGLKCSASCVRSVNYVCKKVIGVDPNGNPLYDTGSGTGAGGNGTADGDNCGIAKSAAWNDAANKARASVTTSYPPPYACTFTDNQTFSQDDCSCS